MRRIVLIVCLLQFSLSNIIAQGLGSSATTGSASPMDADLSIKLINKSWSSVLIESNIEGTPYLFDTWKPGAMVDNSGNLVNRVDLLFDVYNNELLLRKRKSRDTLAINKALISNFKIYGSDSIYYFQRFESNDKKGSGKVSNFYAVLDSGKISLLIKPVKMLHKASTSGYSSYTGKEKDKLISFKEFYVLRNEEGIEKIKLSKKSVLKLMNDQSSAISEHISQEDLDLKSTNDLIEVFRYYNSLD